MRLLLEENRQITGPSPPQALDILVTSLKNLSPKAIFPNVLLKQDTSSCKSLVILAISHQRPDKMGPGTVLTFSGTFNMGSSASGGCGRTRYRVLSPRADRTTHPDKVFQLTQHLPRNSLLRLANHQKTKHALARHVASSFWRSKHLMIRCLVTEKWALQELHSGLQATALQLLDKASEGNSDHWGQKFNIHWVL